MQFQNPKALQPFNLAASISQSLFDVPAKVVIRAPTLFKQFKPKAVEHVLKQIDKDSIRIWHIGENVQATEPLECADGNYRITTIDDNQKKQWQETDIELLLPPCNLPSTKEQQAIIANKAYFIPQLILDKRGVRAFLGHSQHHQALDGLLYLIFLTPINSKSPENLISSHLLTNLFIKKNRDLIQQAAIKFDVEVSLRTNNYGNLIIALGGQTQPQTELIKQLINSYQIFNFTDEELMQEIKPYQDLLNSVADSDITNQLVNLKSQILKTGVSLFTDNEKLGAFRKITLTYLKGFHKQLLTSTFIDTFAFGNYDKEQISNIALSTRQTLGSTSLLKPWFYRSINIVTSGEKESIKRQIKQRNVRLLDTYIYPQKSGKTLVQLTMLNQLFTTPLYSELRTNKQMGYAVQSVVEEVHQHPALSILIESNNTDLKLLKETVNNFLLNFEAQLKKLDKTSIEQLKVAIIDNLSKKPTNLYSEASNYISDWEKTS